MLNTLTISASKPYNLHASKKEENKGLLLSITEFSVQMLGGNPIRTNVVTIFEQYCALYNSASEAPDWKSLALCAAPSLPAGAHGLFLHSCSPTQQRIVREGQKKLDAPMVLSLLQHDICIDFKCLFHIQGFWLQPAESFDVVNLV